LAVGLGPAASAQAPGAPAGSGEPAVYVPRETLVLRWQDGRLWALDLIALANAGDGPAPGVELPLAAGAASVTWEDQPLELADGVVRDPRPLAPGATRRHAPQDQLAGPRWPDAPP